MNHKDYITTLVIVLSMLLLSMAFTSTPPKFLPEVEAQQMSRDERNWEWVNHDSFGGSFNPQSQINEDNVEFLEMKWLFPYRGPDEIGPSGIFESKVKPIYCSYLLNFLILKVTINGQS